MMTDRIHGFRWGGKPDIYCTLPSIQAVSSELLQCFQVDNTLFGLTVLFYLKYVIIRGGNHQRSHDTMLTPRLKRFGISWMFQ